MFNWIKNLFGNKSEEVSEAPYKLETSVVNTEETVAPATKTRKPRAPKAEQAKPVAKPKTQAKKPASTKPAAGPKKRGRKPKTGA